MEFISYLIKGVNLGSVYAIIALGYTMVYGIAKMLNFAHGDVIMIGGYVTYIAMSSLGLPAWIAVLLSVIVCTVLGILIEKVAYRPLREAASSLAVLITAIGVSYLLQNVALLIFGWDLEKAKKYVNINRLKWKSPFDSKIRSESFEDLFEFSKFDFDVLYRGFIQMTQGKLTAYTVTHNISFLTGTEVE